MGVAFENRLWVHPNFPNSEWASIMGKRKGKFEFTLVAWDHKELTQPEDQVFGSWQEARRAGWKKKKELKYV